MSRPLLRALTVLLALLPAAVMTPVQAQPRAQPQAAFDPRLLSKVLHLLLAQPGDYPDDIPKAPGLVVVLAFLDETGAVVDTTLVGGSGNAALDAKSRALVAARHWTPMQVDGAPLGGMALLGVVWTPPGMALPTPEEQRQLLELMGGQPVTPAPPQ
jgi:hypothetical protein